MLSHYFPISRKRIERSTLVEPNCSKEVKSSNDGAWEPRDRRRSVVAHFMIIWDTQLTLPGNTFCWMGGKSTLLQLLRVCCMDAAGSLLQNVDFMIIRWCENHVRSSLPHNISIQSSESMMMTIKQYQIIQIVIFSSYPGPTICLKLCNAGEM